MHNETVSETIDNVVEKNLSSMNTNTKSNHILNGPFLFGSSCPGLVQSERFVDESILRARSLNIRWKHVLTGAFIHARKRKQCANSLYIPFNEMTSFSLLPKNNYNNIWKKNHHSVFVVTFLSHQIHAKHAIECVYLKYCVFRNDVGIPPSTTRHITNEKIDEKWMIHSYDDVWRMMYWNEIAI